MTLPAISSRPARSREGLHQAAQINHSIDCGRECAPKWTEVYLGNLALSVVEVGRAIELKT